MERHVSRRPRFLSGLFCFLLLTCVVPLAGAEWIDLGGDDFEVRLIESDGLRTIYEITVGGFDAEPVLIDGETYYSIGLAGESVDLAAGYPALPDVRRAVIILDDRKVALTLLEVDSVDLPGMPVAPSKGNLLRSVDPATVPYEFGEIYQSGEIWPMSPVDLDAPHILRDYRGVMVDANVFQYLPQTQTLRVHTRMLLEVSPAGVGDINVLNRVSEPEKMDSQFAKIYEGHFLNFGAHDRYTPVIEDGSLLIVAYDAFVSNMQPLVDWKMQKGIDTKLVGTSDTGTTATQILAYIQNEYNTSDLGYVLLVGDGPQIPIPSGGSDPMYSLLAGSDSYPDIFVGRFSAENATHVVTQVERTIHYERDVAGGENWMQYGMGVASNEGPGDDGEDDDEHSDVIRGKLLDYGYSGVDQIYQPTGTAAQVSSGLNTGRGHVNYTGHGSVESWSTTGFSNNHVNVLTNDNKLPFICSVACNNGTFTSSTCYAEAWLRATNGGTPTGAIATYMSYISQSWNPPMCGQDEVVDLLVNDQMRTIGGLYFNGSCQMIDEYGSSGVNEFENWTIFGDPSLAVRTKQAQAMALGHTGAMFIGMTSYDVSIPGLEGALCALYADGVLYGSAVTNAAGLATITMSDAPAEPMSLTLTVTAYNKITAVEAVEVLPPSGPYLVFNDCTVNDDDGDNDGILDEGEDVDLWISVENVGVDLTTNVYGLLSSGDEYVTIVVGNRDFVDVYPGGTGSCIQPFEVVVAGDVPDGHLISFDLELHSDQDIWNTSFSLNAQAPVLSAGALTVIDLPGGNGSGTADAGETIGLRVQLINDGHSDAEDLIGVISSMDPNVTILDGGGACPLVPVGGAGIMSEFSIEILPDCPEPENITFIFNVSNGDFAADLIFELPVGGWFDDFEADRGWTVGAPGDDAATGIWTRVDPNGTEYNGYQIQPEDDHTPAPGTLCFVTGQGSVGGAVGENDVDGGKTTLLSPVFNLDGATSAGFSYWRWYTEDKGTNAGDDYWDVDVTSDGVNWVSLEHTNVSDESWVPMSFELGDFVSLTATVQIRFIASDEGVNSLMEAAVDDVLLNAQWSIQTEVDEGAIPARLALGANFPNPFNPKTTLRFDLPEKGQVDLAVYDVRGRRVMTIASGMMDAGSYELIWNGVDEFGKPVASGVYFSRIAFGKEVLTDKMIMLK